MYCKKGDLIIRPFLKLKLFQEIDHKHEYICQQIGTKNAQPRGETSLTQ